jgi:hypothetical protein
MESIKVHRPAHPSRFASWLVLAVSSLGLPSAHATNFYVATNGSDSNPGTLAQPFLTLAKAQAAEEAAGTNVQRNIYIRGGEYFNVTLYLQGPGGGTGHDDSYCSWIGYPGDPPAILYGGQPLTNWTATSNGWWQASLPAYPAGSLNSTVNKLSNWEVRMLLVDGQMAARAQYPTNGSSLTYPNTSSQANLNYINYKTGDIPPTMVATNAEVMIDWSYDSTTLGVSSIVASNQTINFTFPVWSSRGLQYIPDIQTYRVYNTAEGMANPGQFYFDRGNHVVVYYPIGGKNPNTSEIIVPTTDRMWYLYGYANYGGPGPHDVTFSNLTMKVLAVDRELEGGFGYLWDYMSLINFSPVCGSLNINVENCTLGWCGGNAIGSDYGYVTNFNIINNEIGYCGNYGVAARMAGPVVVSNNYIHDCGLITWQAPGVRVSTNATVIQNNLFNFHTSAIADHDVDNCRYLYNSISNCMTTEEDMGGYYQYFGSATAIPHTVGNIIRSNLFQSVGTNYNVSGGDPRNFYRPAVYLDEQSSNTVVDHNIMLGCPTAVFCNIAHSNAVLNNVFVNTNPGTYMGMRLYISSDSTLPNNVSGNIFYTSTNFVMDNSSLWSSWAGNLCWSTYPLNGGVPAAATISNPMFTSMPNANFTFQTGSPATGMGIVPLTFAQQTLGVGSGSSGSVSNAAYSNAVISWSSPASITYGAPLGSNQLNATANVPGTFAYSPPAGAVVQGGTSQVLSVTFTPSVTNYNVGTTNVTLTVLPVPLTITANNESMAGGAALPAFTASYSGFINGDTASSLTTPVSLTTTASSSSPMGTYPIIAGGAASPSYTISYVNGSLTISEAALTITANNQSMTFGGAVPALTASYSGFVNGDTPSSLTTPVSLSTTATSNSPVGIYPIIAGGASSSNYAISYVNGSLVINPVMVTVNYYVATNGSDSNPGTLAQPFLTLAKAQAAEEAAGATVQRNIYIRGGEYFNVTLFLQGPGGGAGHDDSYCSWMGYPGDPPAILYGGQPLTNWTATSNGWWQASLPAYPAGSLNSGVNKLSNWEVRMLLVDGQMAARAQYPTNGSSLTYPNTSSQANLNYINYKTGDIPPTMVATNAEVMIDWSYDSTTLGVSSIVASNQTINFTFPVWSSRGLQYIPDIQTYRVYNTVEGMANPGQFYFDRGNHVVVYYPIGGKNPNTSEIIVPTTDRMWYLYGYANYGGPGPHDVTFSNLTMKVLAVDRELEGGFGYLWDYMSLINFSPVCGSLNINVENCTLGWCGGNAIGSDYGYVTNFNIINNEIGYCGNYGVAARMAGPVVVSNNYIHDCGLITWQAPGVRVSTNATVIQNNLFNFHTSAIADHDVDNCRYLYNSISNCMTTEEDMGGYYQYFGSATAIPHTVGNIIRSNLFQSVGTNYNVSGGDPRNFYRPAVYLDEQSSNTVVDHNITLGCPTPFFCNIAHSNAVLNNVFVNTNTPDSTGYAGWVRMYSSSDTTPPNLVGQNVYYACGSNIVDNPTLWSSWAANLFWSTSNLTKNVPAGATVANPMFTNELSSIIAFQSGSPASGMGISPLILTPLFRGVTGVMPPPAPTGLRVTSGQ